VEYREFLQRADRKQGRVLRAVGIVGLHDGIPKLVRRPGRHLDGRRHSMRQYDLRHEGRGPNLGQHKGHVQIDDSGAGLGFSK
jgi:hypothetical protein